MSSEVRLRVAEVRQRDVGRGKARIDNEAFGALGISAGDIIEICGMRTTAAMAWPAYPEDQGKGIIWIDELIRKNAGVAINEFVTIKKAEAKEAQNVVLAPIDVRLNVDKEFTSFVKARLMEIPLVEGDTVFLIILGSPVPLTVMCTRPHGIVKLSETTLLQLMNEPTEGYLELTPEREEKKFRRFAWLKAMERKCASDYVKFYIPEYNVQTDREDEALSEAEKIAQKESKPIAIFIQLWEKRGMIGSLQWARVNPDKTIEYIYPESFLRVCPLCGEPTTPYYGRDYCYRCGRYI